MAFIASSCSDGETPTTPTAVCAISLPNGTVVSTLLASLPNDAPQTVSIPLRTGDNCDWTATSGVAWLSLSQTSGRGDATVVATVANNTSTAARSGTVTINDQIVSLSQAGGSGQIERLCIAPTAASRLDRGGPQAVDLFFRLCAARLVEGASRKMVSSGDRVATVTATVLSAVAVQRSTGPGYTYTLRFAIENRTDCRIQPEIGFSNWFANGGGEVISYVVEARQTLTFERSVSVPSSALNDPTSDGLAAGYQGRACGQ